MKPQIFRNDELGVMNDELKKLSYIHRSSLLIHHFFYLWLISSVLFFGACNQLEKPQPQPYYSQTAPPPKQEFRWSNGKMPKSFDPALAAAPPETDIVRAVFDGLTDTDAKNLQTLPAVAREWKSSDDKKTWTFSLRRDAKWSNGETVKAQDFVRSWKRLAEMSEKVAHYELLSNIVGTRISGKEILPEKDTQKLDVLAKNTAAENLQVFPKQSDSNSSTVLQGNENKTTEAEKTTGTQAKLEQKPKTENKTEIKFGVEAIDNFTLKISLIKPDKDFPALVAHPIFRPVYGDGKQFETGKLNADIVTNGAFRIFSVGQDGITLDRAEHYWNRKAVEIERVRFVPTENAEKALEAYRAGEVDAVTNAEFEPLALKLLTPFDDFRRTTHSALNFYEFNLNRKPFDDRRVREALAIAIERERLTEDDMDGASLPALSFLPFDEAGNTKFAQDTNRAKNLLAEAGFPDGRDFPVIRLLVNRNNIQQRIAKSVAKMWKQNLNIETEIVVKDSAELEVSMQAADFDILRRGVVLATTDETMNMSMIFAGREKVINEEGAGEMIDEEANRTSIISENPSLAGVAPEQPNQAETLSDKKLSDENAVLENPEKFGNAEPVLTEAEALKQFQAIPLYFPTSYSLVKSYVQGFEINTLDAPSLKDVKINSDYKPKTANGEQ
jgi:oligopeptide transport system substrate-binding protein